MSDNFEASFEEQLQEIEAEVLDHEVGLDALPAALSEPQSAAPYCFPYPGPETACDDPATILRELAWDGESRKRAATMMADFCDPALEARLLGGVDSETQLAAARILAVLVCAEESAINIFHHETARIEAEQVKANRLALKEIETEERVHNWLIQQARAFYPEPEDLAQIRRRTRRLFMRVGSRDLGTHFARITGLDSGVCISLSALLGSNKAKNIKGFAQLLRHIRHDEATHVKKSRDHAMDLGFDRHHFHECYELTREGMVGMLTPIASSFEALEVDPDRLFARLMRFQGSNMPDAVELND